MPLLLCVYFWDGLVFFVVFFSLLGLWGSFFVCFVVGVMVGGFFFVFFIWPNSFQRRVIFMPGIYKLPATRAYMLQLLHIIH